MSETGDARAIAGWIRRFRWSLGGIPGPERDEIVAEVRGHISERVAAGASVTDALNAFGTPEGYARSFVEEMELMSAISGGGTPSLLNVVMRRAHRSLIAAASFVAVLMLAALALGVAVTAVAELIAPEEAGLWIGRNNFFFGMTDEPEGMRELLGPWILPLAPLVVGLAWVLARLVLLRAARAMRAR
jgi:hypothetical protein